MAPTVIDRLALKTLDQRFQHELETGFELAPRVSQGILALAKEVFSLDQASANKMERLRPGRIRQIIAAAGVRPGRPLAQADLVAVTWTLDAGVEDLEVLERHGRVALRRVRLLRLVEEALDQGGQTHPLPESRPGGPLQPRQGLGASSRSALAPGGGRPGTPVRVGLRRGREGCPPRRWVSRAGCLVSG